MIRSLRHDLVRYRELIRQLAARDLKSRYKVSVLGFFWSLLRPLLTIAVLAVVFSMLMDMKGETYNVPYWVLLSAAYIPWFFFSNAFLEGTQSLLANAHLVKKVYSPRAVYPAAAALSNLVNFLLSLLVVVPLIYAGSGALPGWQLLQLPFVIGFHTLFLVGLCFFTAALNVLYRDTTQISEFLIFVWFYLSPVLYDVELVRQELDGGLRWLYCLNPMVGILEWYRYALLANTATGSDWHSSVVLYMAVPYAAIVSVAVFFAGYGLLKKLETRAVDEL